MSVNGLCLAFTSDVPYLRGRKTRVGPEDGGASASVSLPRGGLAGRRALAASVS